MKRTRKNKKIKILTRTAAVLFLLACITFCGGTVYAKYQAVSESDTKKSEPEKAEAVSESDTEKPEPQKPEPVQTDDKTTWFYFCICAASAGCLLGLLYARKGIKS